MLNVEKKHFDTELDQLPEKDNLKWIIEINQTSIKIFFFNFNTAKKYYWNINNSIEMIYWQTVWIDSCKLIRVINSIPTCL